MLWNSLSPNPEPSFCFCDFFAYLSPEEGSDLIYLFIVYEYEYEYDCLYQWNDHGLSSSVFFPYKPASSLILFSTLSLLFFFFNILDTALTSALYSSLAHHGKYFFIGYFLKAKITFLSLYLHAILTLISDFYFHNF